MKNTCLKVLGYSFLFSVFAVINTQAQNLNIVGDTIRVSKSHFAQLKFMSEPNYQRLCETYGVFPDVRDEKIITVRPLEGSKSGSCQLLITEGSKNNPRQHVFTIIYDPNASGKIYDFSSKELITERVQYLEKVNGAAGAGAQTAAKPPKDKKLKLPFKKSKAPKAPEVKAPEVKSPEVKSPEVKAPEVKAPDATTTKAPDAKSAGAKPAASKPPAKSGSKNTSVPATSPATDKKSVNSGSKSTNSINDAGSADIMSIPTDQIEERVTEKIGEFYSVCQKLLDGVETNAYIELGIRRLFNNNDTIIVETTNTRTGQTKKATILEYFKNLVLLGKTYGKVKMTTSEINFVSEFQYDEATNQWRGTAIVLQDFEADKDYKLVYSDQTTKIFDVILKVLEIAQDGQTVLKFEIYFGNIKVERNPR